MPDDKRQDVRIPIGLRVRLQFADVREFVAAYAANLSRNGLFLEGVPARPTDSMVRFELLLADGSAALRGEGRVIWSRASGPKAGLALRFTKLDGRSKQLLDEMTQGHRLASGSIPPPPPPQAMRVSPRTAAGSIATPSEPPRERAPLRLDKDLHAPSAPPLQTPSHVQEAPRRSHPAAETLVSDLDLLAEPLLDKLAARSRLSVNRRSLADLDRDLETLVAESPGIAASRRAIASAVAPRVHEDHDETHAAHAGGRGSKAREFGAGSLPPHDAVPVSMAVPVALPELELAEMSEPGGERIALRSTPPEPASLTTSRARGDG